MSASNGQDARPKWYVKAKERMALMKRFAVGTDVHLLEMACTDYDRLHEKVRQLEMPWAQLMKQANADEGVDTQVFMTRLWKKVEDQKRELAKLQPSSEPCEQQDLERYKRSLYQANGRLIQLDLEPVKLEFTNLGRAEAEVIAGDDKTEARPVASTAQPTPPPETGCKDCPHSKGTAHTYDCGYPECVTSPPGEDPNEGPVVNGLVQIPDGVLPPFYNEWKCSQCGRDPRDVKFNGCGYSRSCGRAALTKSGGAT